ncbi:MAG: hypothetical protein HKM98_09875, partial [Gammaproteobacteria bacterium]|nr:hypothetical protein [Gammaproteobacteria bacterium]
MRFSYYSRLNKKQRRIYDESDSVTAVQLDKPTSLRSNVHHLASALASEDRLQVERTSRALTDGICRQLNVDESKLRVRSVRPSDD